MRSEAEGAEAGDVRAEGTPAAKKKKPTAVRWSLSAWPVLPWRLDLPFAARGEALITCAKADCQPGQIRVTTE